MWAAQGFQQHAARQARSTQRGIAPKKAVLAANQEAQQTSLARTGDLLRAHASAASGIALGQMLELIELM